jgi:hypothetical protein
MAIEALSGFPRDHDWVLIGGLAVFLRLGSITRVTADVDTIARSQAELLDALSGYDFVAVVSGGNLEVAVRGTPIDVDVMDLSDDPLPDDDERRAFALARRAALDSAVDERIIVRTADGHEVANTEIPVASISAMVGLKAVSMVRRPHGSHPEKVGSDIHDLVRLVAAAGAKSIATALVGGDAVLSKWIATQLDRAFVTCGTRFFDCDATIGRQELKRSPMMMSPRRRSLTPRSRTCSDRNLESVARPPPSFLDGLEAFQGGPGLATVDPEKVREDRFRICPPSLTPST